MTPAQLQAHRLVQGIAPLCSWAKPDDWEFKDFLMGMAHQYHTDISQYDSADGIEALVVEHEMTIVRLYDHLHSSDECCSVHMLMVKGVPLVGWQRVGDRSDYSDGIVVFNDEEGRVLARRVWQLVNKTQTVGHDNLDVLDWMFENNQYILPVKDLPHDPVAYALNHPNWCEGRIDPKKHVLYAFKPSASGEARTASRVVRVVSTRVSGERHSVDACHRTTVEFEDQTQCEVETDCIIITPLRAPA